MREDIPQRKDSRGYLVSLETYGYRQIEYQWCCQECVAKIREIVGAAAGAPRLPG